MRQIPSSQSESASRLRRADACAQIAVDHDEPMLGVVPERAISFLLIEETRSWGDRAVLTGGLLPTEAKERFQALGLRVLFIRRGYRYEAKRRTCFLLRPGATWVRRVQVDDARDLLDLDLDAFSQGHEPAVGEPHHGSLVLVCTHGKVDACCAEAGLPVARELTAKFGDLVWHSSHVGGCRFAANVLLLPAGLHLGRLRAGNAAGVLADAMAGHPPREHLRGQIGTPRTVQVATAHLHDELGPTEVETLARQAIDENTDEVVLATRGRRWRLLVRAEPATTQRAQGCGDNELWTPMIHRVVQCRPEDTPGTEDTTNAETPDG